MLSVRVANLVSANLTRIALVTALAALAAALVAALVALVATLVALLLTLLAATLLLLSTLRTLIALLTALLTALVVLLVGAALLIVSHDFPSLAFGFARRPATHIAKYVQAKIVLCQELADCLVGILRTFY